LPLVPPVRHVQAPEPGSGLRAAPPPGREPTPDPARQAGERLHEMEEQDNNPEPDDRPPPLRIHRDEVRPPGADRGVRDRQGNGDDQRRPEDDRRAPTEAQGECPRQEADHQVPLGSKGQGPTRTSGLVEGLERRGAPDPLVDAPADRRQIAADPLSVDSSEPAQLPHPTVSARPLPFEEGLGFPVPDLLSPELANGFAAVVPDDRGRRVPDETSAVPEPPAHIDIVAGGSEDPVESTDRLERVLTERHVASGDVLRDGVGEEDGVLTDGSVSDSGVDPTVFLMLDVLSSLSDVLLFLTLRLL